MSHDKQGALEFGFPYHGCVQIADKWRSLLRRLASRDVPRHDSRVLMGY